MDANSIKRDVLIGGFAIALETIYEAPNHNLRTWVALQNPEQASEVMGYLKVRQCTRKMCACVEIFESGCRVVINP